MIDQELFIYLQKYLSAPNNQRVDSYSNSIAYYALTGRLGAWLCEDDKCKALVCRHPDKNNTLLIFPEIGLGNGSLIASIIINPIYAAYDLQLARFEKHEIANVREVLKAYPHIQLEEVVETVLDWQYPIHILDTEKVAMLEGAEFRNSRQKMRKIDERAIQFMSIKDDHALRYLMACTKYWEGNRILSNHD